VAQGDVVRPLVGVVDQVALVYLGGAFLAAILPWLA
jgi:hypothetical protein